MISLSSCCILTALAPQTPWEGRSTSSRGQDHLQAATEPTCVSETLRAALLCTVDPEPLPQQRFIFTCRSALQVPVIPKTLSSCHWTYTLINSYYTKEEEQRSC